VKDVEVSVGPVADLAEYGRISSAFLVESVLEPDLRQRGLGGILLAERAVAVPYVKDYEADAGERPSTWPEEFDVARWALVEARAGGRLVGGAVVAFDTPGVDMLERRRDLAVLWDLRVARDARRSGVGSRLFQAVEGWARERGCRRLKVETQNINVAANRFYAHHGCVLGALHRFGYPDLPAEVQLLWYKDLVLG
jgi:GNAT superfamily N-acetyltransferase